MLDRLGRTIDYLRLSLTDRCNLRCRYCVPENPTSNTSGNDQLTLEDLVFVVSCTAEIGVRRVRLTGGEPLLVPYLTELVSKISAVQGIEDIALTTNGLGLDSRAYALRIAGLRRVNISIDSLQEDKYRFMSRGGSLREAMAGVDAAIRVGLNPVKINCVVIGGFNDDEVMDFALLTHELPVAVRFIELMPFGECSEWPSSAFVPLDVVRQKLGELEEATVIGAGPAKVYRLKGAMGTLGFIDGVSNHFCSSCNRLRITSHGLIRPCLFADVELSAWGAIKNRDKDGLQRIIANALGIKPDRLEVLRGRRMAEIGG